MSFNQLQREVSDLLSKDDSSISDYLSLYKQLSSHVAEQPHYFRKIKVAFLSNFTLLGLPEVFQVQAIAHNIWADTYLGQYNQYAQEILDPESGFNKFKPELVFIILDSTKEQLDKLIELALLIRDKYIRTRVIFLNTNKISTHDTSDPIQFIDLHKLLKELSLSHHWGTKYKELGDLRIAPSAFPKLVGFLMKEAIAQSGATKKCLVLDLDNTLWRGVVGEDDFDGIVPFCEFQERVLDLYKQGVILAVNSKNNLEDAWRVFESREDMVLRKEHLAAWRINWQSKSQNMIELAKELNLGLDSFVFVDDDLFQLAEVKNAFPEIAVLTPHLFEGYTGFSVTYLTEEDRRRGQMYAEERHRRELPSYLKSVDDFIKDLNLKVAIKELQPKEAYIFDSPVISRVAQMTQRTNQFNMAPDRWTEENVRTFLQRGIYKMWTIEARDRFGDYGIVGFICTVVAFGDWTIGNFLMSCRILGRGIENVLLAHVIQNAKDADAKNIQGFFRPTKKNIGLCEKFYINNGFTFSHAGDDGFYYKYDLKKRYSYPEGINII